MKLCFIGKYPPIEGGVSAATYWLARGLAEGGHEVHVVTNAAEVEERYRTHFEADDWHWYQPEFELKKGRVRVYNPEFFTHSRMAHIPVSNPFVSKLASLATDIVRREDCEAIFAYYYEPYLVAGWLVSQWTGRPLIVKHAGSDLERLFRVPDLATAYKELLRSSAGVITRPALMPRFLAMGVRPHQLHPDIPFSVPVPLFSPKAEPLDVERVRVRPQGTGTVAGSIAAPPFDYRTPTIGIYGKVGPHKGTYDLITSLGQLAQEGHSFNLIAMIGGPQGETLATALLEAGIAKRTYILKFLPHWKVPRFINTCTAVCFLERDFPIACQGSMVPREVLACGRCLVISDESASKHRDRLPISSGNNVVIVDDPKNHHELVAALRQILTNPDRSLSIGERGLGISRGFEDFGAYLRGWEELFASYVADGAESRSDKSHSPQPYEEIPQGTEMISPRLLALLRLQCPDVLQGFSPISPAGSVLDKGIDFCSLISTRLAHRTQGDEISKLLVALDYQKARLITIRDLDEARMPPFFVVDCLETRTVSVKSAWHLRPVRSTSVRIVEFSYDVSSLYHTEPSIRRTTQDDRLYLASLRPQKTAMLFQCSANLHPHEMHVDTTTRELVGRCDGTKTTAELIDDMRPYCEPHQFERREPVASTIITALDRLYRANVIVFGDRPSTGGWVGGLRSRSTFKSVSQFKQ